MTANSTTGGGSVLLIGKREPNCRSDSFAGAQLEATTHVLDQVFDDRKTEAQPSPPRRAGAVDPVEAVQDSLELIGGDALAGT